MLYQGPEDSSTFGKMVSQWWQFNFLAMLLDHTINTHFLSPGLWHTVLTGSTRIPVHPRNMLYRGPQDFSKPGKPVLAWTSVGILAILSGSSHDYTHFSPLKCYRVMTDSTWPPFGLWEILYQGPEDASTPRKPVVP